MKVFVSYQRADTLFAAHAVGYALRAAGHEPFVDTGSIGGGELYREVIGQAMSTANLVLALIGPSFDFPRLHQGADVVAYEWRRARFHGLAVVPVFVDGGRIGSDAALPPELRWIARPNAYHLRRNSLSGDMTTLVEAVPPLAVTPRRSARVLWVDDRPANNESERRALRPHGIVFDNVVSTAEAVDQLANESYDLVITDLGRAHSSDRSQAAGALLLQSPLIRDAGPPVIVYAGTRAVRQWRDRLLQLGAAEVTSDFARLVESVLGQLGRAPDTPG